VTAEQVDPTARASRAGGLRVGVSVIEVRPSSFDMAVRLRPAGQDQREPANGHCAVVIERQATGERIVIPREVRDEFIAIQLGAQEFC
jgi:acyl-CoA thioesterase FadM